MTASERTPRRSARAWRGVCRAARWLITIHAGQTLMWEIWWQANRATAPDSGPLTWVLTLDGYRLAGSHLSTADEARTGGRP